MYVSDIKHTNTTLEEKLHKLYALNRSKELDLSFRPPFLNLLKKFKNPHTKLPPIIHVAGTNGKGSVIAILKALLEAGGYKVHAYTSPHLQKFNERIYLAGDNISDEMLEPLLDETLTLNDGAEITFFEATTAMAFTAFARTPADILLLETGLGGRLDCTNIIETALTTVITKIAWDHTNLLGDTLAAIAAEKAGIMKLRVPCVIGHQSCEATQNNVPKVFNYMAEGLKASLYRADKEWSIKTHKNLMHFSFSGHSDLELPRPSLEGEHQIQNAGTALATLKVIEKQFPVSTSSLFFGLRKVKWPGRLQKLDQSAFNLSNDWSVWLDGGHNEDAAHALATQIQIWKTETKKPVHLIMAMMAHKDPSAFLKPLLPHIDILCVTNILGEPKSWRAKDLTETLKGLKRRPDIQQAETLQKAVNTLQKTNPDPAHILIAGSFYMVGATLQQINKKSD